MNIPERNIRLQGFYAEATEILEKKGRDYNPDGIAFSEVKEIAEDVGIKPEQVLMVFANKHWQAIKAHARGGQVASEPIRERLKDMSNYMALYAVMIETRIGETQDSMEGRK